MLLTLRPLWIRGGRWPGPLTLPDPGQRGLQSTPRLQDATSWGGYIKSPSALHSSHRPATAQPLLKNLTSPPWPLQMNGGPGNGLDNLSSRTARCQDAKMPICQDAKMPVPGTGYPRVSPPPFLLDQKPMPVSTTALPVESTGQLRGGDITAGH